MGQSTRDSRSPAPRRRPCAGLCSSPPGSVPVPDPPRGQPYFPLLLRLFPLLRGGDRALRAWVRFRGLPGPLRAKLLWGSSRLSLKKNHTLGCELRGGGARRRDTRCAHITRVLAHLCRPTTADLLSASAYRANDGAPGQGRAGPRDGAGRALTRTRGASAASPAPAASPCIAAAPRPAACGSPAPQRPCSPGTTSWRASVGREAVRTLMPTCPRHPPGRWPARGWRGFTAKTRRPARTPLLPLLAVASGTTQTPCHMTGTRSPTALELSLAGAGPERPPLPTARPRE